MTIEIWYVPFFNLAAIVYVLGEVKSVNLESWTNRAVVYTGIYITENCLRPTGTPTLYIACQGCETVSYHMIPVANDCY